MFGTGFRLFLKPTTLGTFVTKRSVSTLKTTSKQAQELLVAQRGNRPVSPHLTIYQPQLTWYLSSLHRISGVVLGAGFFALTIGIGASSLLGYDVGARDIAQWYHLNVPKWADYTLKGSASYLFAFHAANGVRHLIWDAGKALSIRGVYVTGYVALFVMAVGGTALFLQ